MQLVGVVNEPAPTNDYGPTIPAATLDAPILTASQLRKDVYNILDRVLATGEPATIIRNGRTLRIVAEREQHWLDSLPDRSHLYPDGVDDLHEFKTPYEWNEGEPTP